MSSCTLRPDRCRLLQQRNGAASRDDEVNLEANELRRDLGEALHSPSASSSPSVAADMRDLFSRISGPAAAEAPGALWSFLGRGRIDYTLYLNSGFSQPR